jgi:hypothetical protein
MSMFSYRDGETDLSDGLNQATSAPQLNIWTEAVLGISIPPFLEAKSITFIYTMCLQHLEFDHL